MGKEQAAEGIKRGMDDMVSFTDFLHCMDMQEIGFQHGQDKAAGYKKSTGSASRGEGHGYAHRKCT